MTAEELRAIMAYLRERVTLAPGDAEGPVTIAFEQPTEEGMVAAGLNAQGSKRILGMPWWREMVTDILETPEMCDPEDPPEQVLGFARDVVSEYIRKRFPLEGN